MSPFVLAVLKYSFLALVYFFVFRALRAVASDISARQKRPKGPDAKQGRQTTKSAMPGKGKPPTVVVVRDDGGRKLASHALSDTLQIGRAEACHVRIGDRYASQFHARLYPKNGSWYVEDLGSTNGTYLNRRRLTGSAEVHAGDAIRIGKTTLELRR